MAFNFKIFYFILFLAVLDIEHKASDLLSKHSITKLHL